MAKTTSSGGASERRAAQTAENGDEAKTFTREQVGALAEQLRWHAELIDKHVELFEELEIARCKVQAGNFRKATKILREFINKQLSSKILRESASGIQSHMAMAKISTEHANLLTKLGVDE